MRVPFLIHDSTPSDITHPKRFGRGLELERRGADGYGAAAKPFPRELLIPRSEWRSRIEEMEAMRSRLSDLLKLRKIPPLNQSNTNFCWCNAPVMCTQIVRAKQHSTNVLLSPASVACPITGFQNRGGWGREALERIAEVGCCPVDLWPANAINRKFDNDASRAACAKFRVVEWTELEPRNHDQVISLLLRRIPIAVGFNWWGHEVTLVDPVWRDGEAIVRILNSWGEQFGDQGYAELQGSRMLADDAVAPFSANAA